MRWQRILQDDLGAGEPLTERITSLFDQQRATWPMLRDGEAALDRLRKKTLRDGDEEIIVQLNVGRRRSTHAKVDAQSLAARPCFLCPENMPPEERGVPFENLIIMPNPFPVLPLHCTIADREHVPQRLADRIDLLARLAAEAGPELAVFYNGPQCGASAPDHFHFQAASARHIPVLNPWRNVERGHPPTARASFGRSMLVSQTTRAADVQRNIEQTLSSLAGTPNPMNEPMVNVLVHHTGEEYRTIVFPRAAHRPKCYSAEGPERLGVSPAVLEMAGILVVTESDQFDRLDSRAAKAIYHEVSYDVTGAAHGH